MKQVMLIFTVCLAYLFLFTVNKTAANPQILIPSGEFNMGTEKGTQAERPLHRVWVDAFFMDRFEVSNKDYEQLNPNFQRSQASPCDDCPVTQVNWEEAKTYCQKLKKRLPTEAEWEKSRRGPNEIDAGSDKKKSRYGLSFEAGTAPVQSYIENGYGLHHMEGNVWEWTNDWFDEKYYQNSPEKNPRGPSEGSRRSVRGGSWYNDIWYLQAGMRFRLAPDVKLNSLGFRCAKNS